MNVEVGKTFVDSNPLLVRNQLPIPKKRMNAKKIYMRFFFTCDWLTARTVAGKSEIG